jgi:hypothetical protein
LKEKELKEKELKEKEKQESKWLSVIEELLR